MSAKKRELSYLKPLSYIFLVLFELKAHSEHSLKFFKLFLLGFLSLETLVEFFLICTVELIIKIQSFGLDNIIAHTSKLLDFLYKCVVRN